MTAHPGTVSSRVIHVPRFLANCLVVAIVAAVLGNRMAWMRNRRGRMHFFWRGADGKAYEFYGAGASQRSYLGNCLYLGRVKRAPSLDEPQLTVEQEGGRHGHIA